MDFYTVAHHDVVDRNPHVGFEFLSAVLLKIQIFREMTLRLLAGSSQSFEESQCFYLQQ
jgi:hypothetical protein